LSSLDAGCLAKAGVGLVNFYLMADSPHWPKSLFGDRC
jgi:hypothetical protein